MSTKTAHGSLFPESQKLAKGGKSQITRHGAGVFTTEGNVAGARAGRLAANREKERLQYMKDRDALKAKHAKKSVTDINKNFSRTTNENERKFKEATVGMVTLEEFRRAKAETGVGGKGGAGSPGADTEADSERRKKKLEAKRLKKKRKQKKMMARLSFAGAGEDEEEEDQAEGAGDGSPASAAAEAGGDAKKQRFSKFGKDPTVATDFLPDRDRELQEQQQREKLKTQWLKQQEKVKAESLQVTYSYWDGSGHRRDIIVTKGMTMRQFLEAVRRDLLQEFPELRSVSVENLMYVKEDLIIPHNYTFYDLIISKARGKSGPLFHFDVHDDVRIGLNDSRIEKDESHPGKIVERRWFEINKHIFPASRWEVYDPKKDWGGYTIHGGEVRGKNADEDGDDSAALAGWWSIGAGL